METGRGNGGLDVRGEQRVRKSRRHYADWIEDPDRRGERDSIERDEAAEGVTDRSGHWLRWRRGIGRRSVMVVMKISPMKRGTDINDAMRRRGRGLGECHHRAVHEAHESEHDGQHRAKHASPVCAHK